LFKGRKTLATPPTPNPRPGAGVEFGSLRSVKKLMSNGNG
jgi:hypothetical protein